MSHRGPHRTGEATRADGGLDDRSDYAALAPDPVWQNAGDGDVELYGGDPGLDIGRLRRRQEVVLTVLALTVVLGIAVFAAVRFGASPHPKQTELAALAQDAVQAALPATVVVAFSWTDELRLKALGPARYELAGPFQVISRDGVARLLTFECVFESGERAWRVVQVKVTQGY